MENPSGLCLCGCGEQTMLADKTRSKRGWVKGKPVDFIRGHNARKLPRGWEVRDEGFITPCWMWSGTRDTDGYGMWGQGRHAYVEIYEQQKGPVPKGHLLHHLCENPPCVNPDHLQPATRGEHNTIHNKKVLTPELVDEIRRAAGSQRAIAARLGVSQFTVANVQHRRSWLDR